MDDLIRRQDAIDALFEWYETPMDQDAVDVICNVPSAQPEVIACSDGELKSESQWIPCSERLPEAYKGVLTCTKHGMVCENFRTSSGWSRGLQIIAWMPLPKPYQYPLDIRDCDHCKHYVTRDGQTGCEKWECEFERRQ